MAVRTPAAAASWARVPRSGFGGLCLQHTRMAYNVPSLHRNARTAWQKAKHRHAGLAGIRVGAPLFMDRPSSVHGHVATWLGNNQIATTDSTSKTTRVDSLSRWTNAGWKILGWTEDLNGVRVLPAQKASGGSSSGSSSSSSTAVLRKGSSGTRVRNLQKGLRTKFPTYRTSVKVRRGQLIDTDGSYGDQTVAWVREFQGRSKLVSDGITGPKTQSALRTKGITL